MLALLQRGHIVLFCLVVSMFLNPASAGAVPTDGFIDDVVYVTGDVTGGNGIPWTMDTEALAVSTSGSEQLGAGAVEAAGSLASGFLRAKISAITAGCCLEGQASVLLGLVSKIDLIGPANVGGVVTVTMRINGTYDCCGPQDSGAISFQSSYVTAPGQRCCGTADPALR